MWRRVAQLDQNHTETRHLAQCGNSGPRKTNRRTKLADEEDKLMDKVRMNARKEEWVNEGRTRKQKEKTSKK
jgi:hypothetical protein